MHLDDTIVAIATPTGRGGIGVVRLSGPGATSIAVPMLRQAHTDGLQPNRAQYKPTHRRSGSHLLCQATLLHHRRRSRDFLSRLTYRPSTRSRDGDTGWGPPRRAR